MLEWDSCALKRKFAVWQNYGLNDSHLLLMALAACVSPKQFVRESSAIMVTRGAALDVAIVSDIHGNLTALEAVLADIRQVSPDFVLHGGDLADGGSSPVEVVDMIRDLGWQGVMGNTDEMLVDPTSLEEFASRSSAPPALWAAIRQIASATRSALGNERLEWLSKLPRLRVQDGFALVHATPECCWRTPASTASDAELEETYGPLGEPVVAFGHTHLPAIRSIAGRPQFLVNTGSVGLSYDGDARASYLLLRGSTPTIRRVEYNVEREMKALSCCGLPGADWTAKMLRTSSPQMP
jgi:putative phosphoesterase